MRFESIVPPEIKSRRFEDMLRTMRNTQVASQTGEKGICNSVRVAPLTERVTLTELRSVEAASLPLSAPSA